jgi:hypothetical protein
MRICGELTKPNPARNRAASDPEVSRCLGPSYVLLALTTIAAIGNLYAPSLWPLALPLGAAVTGALWRWKTDRRAERAYVLAIGAAGLPVEHFKAEQEKDSGAGQGTPG